MLLNWPRPIEEQPPHGWVLEIGSLVAPEVTEGAGNNLMVALKYLARIFCKKIGSDCSFLTRMAVQNFASAYRGLPPPAVFHDKYQSYKYEKHSREIC